MNVIWTMFLHVYHCLPLCTADEFIHLPWRNGFCRILVEIYFLGELVRWKRRINNTHPATIGLRTATGVYHLSTALPILSSFSSWPHLLLALIDSIQTQTLILEEPEPLVMMSFSVRRCSAYPFTITTGKGLPRGTQVGHQDSTRDPLSLQETMGQTRGCVLYLCVCTYSQISVQWVKIFLYLLILVSFPVIHSCTPFPVIELIIYY